jgi:hypothetical protein
MASRLMGSVSQWNQIEPDLPVPNYYFIPKICIYVVHSLIVTIWLMESVWVCPKVVPLNDVYCILSQTICRY